MSNILENTNPVAIPPIEKRPPKIAAKKATITPKMAPRTPMIAPSIPAPIPIMTPPIGMARIRIKGSSINKRRNLTLSIYGNTQSIVE